MIVIDDDPVDLLLTTKVIERSGLVADLLTFDLAVPALEYLQANQDTAVDIILLDIKMPLMDGYEFLAAADNKLRPAYARAVVVMLSANDPKGRDRASQYAVVKQFIEKPMQTQDLAGMADLLRAIT